MMKNKPIEVALLDRDRKTPNAFEPLIPLSDTPTEPPLLVEPFLHLAFSFRTLVIALIAILGYIVQRISHLEVSGSPLHQIREEINSAGHFRETSFSKSKVLSNLLNIQQFTLVMQTPLVSNALLKALGSPSVDF
ncbi:hypothetical protein L7F22_006823 [Adiantum nelumboides]|nr:hypothetical protein [Adiantum nelumboides]